MTGPTDNPLNSALSSLRKKLGLNGPQVLTSPDDLRNMGAATYAGARDLIGRPTVASQLASVFGNNLDQITSGAVPLGTALKLTDRFGFKSIASRFGTTVANSQAERQALFQHLSRNYMGVEEGLLPLLNQASSAHFNIVFNADQHALFLQSRMTGHGMALPLQRRGAFNRGVVYWGDSKRGAYMAKTAEGNFRSFSELYYNELRVAMSEGTPYAPTQVDALSSSFGQLLENTSSFAEKLRRRVLGATLYKGSPANGVSTVTMRSMLQEGSSIRHGMNYYGQKYLTIGSEIEDGGRSFLGRVLRFADTMHPIDAARIKLRQANAELNMAASSVNDPSRVQAMTAARLAKEQAHVELAAAIRAEGILASLPYAKPEHFTQERRPLLLPMPDTSGLYGDAYGKPALTKGRFWEARLAPLSDTQIGHFVNAGTKRGERVFPYLMTGQMYREAQQNPALFHRMFPTKAAVLQFSSDLEERRLVGDAGGYMFNKLASKLAEPQMLREIKLSNSIQALEDIQTVFGINMGDFSRKVNVRGNFRYNHKEVSQIARGVLHDEDHQALRRLMKSSIKGTSHWQSLAGHTKDMVDASGPVDENYRLGAQLTEIERRDGQLVLRFHSSADMLPASTASVIHSRRATLVRPDSAHELNPIFQVAKMAGADVAINSTDFLKGLESDPFNAMYHMAGVLLEGGESAASYLTQLEGVSIAHRGVIHPLRSKQAKEALKHREELVVVMDEQVGSQAMYRSGQKLLNQLSSGNDFERALHRSIVGGIRAAGQAMDVARKGTSVEDMTMFYTPLGVRLDNLTDQSADRLAKITSSKMRMLNLTSRYLGYEGPDAHPMARLINARWQQRTGYKMLQRTLGVEHPKDIVDFIAATVGNGVGRASPNILRWSEQGLTLNQHTFGRIAGTDVLDQFKHGIPEAQFLGTLFDKQAMKREGTWSKTMFLDLGRMVEMSVHSRGDQPVMRKMRYVPINMALLRIGYDTDNRIRLGKNGLAKPLYQVLRSFQELGPDLLDPTKHAAIAARLGTTETQVGGMRAEFLRGVQGYLTGVTKRLAGKPKGLLERFATLYVEGVYGRLAPQFSNFHTLADMTDANSVFTVYLNKKQVLDTYRSRLSGKQFEKLRNELAGKKDVTMYGLYGVNPAQKPEHLPTVRYVITDRGVGHASQGRMNIVAHPYMMARTNRDLDKDIAFNMLVEQINMPHQEREVFRREMEEVIRRQAGLHSAGIKIWAQHMASKKPGQITTVQDFYTDAQRFIFNLGSQTDEQVAKYLEDFLGQKTSAHLGYTVWRGSRGLPELLATAGNDEFRQVATGLGARTASHFTDAVIAELRNAAGSHTEFQQLHVEVSNLISSLMNAGVGKGKSKGALLDTIEGIGRMRANAATSSLEELQHQATSVFETFYESMLTDTGFGDIEKREFGGMFGTLIQESGQSVDQVLAGLREGNLEVMRRIQTRAAQKLGQYFGMSTYAHSRAGSPLVDPMTVFESKNVTERTSLKKVIQSVVGQNLEQLDAAELPFRESFTEAERAAAEEIMGLAAPASRQAEAVAASRRLGKWGLVGAGVAIGAVAANMLMGESPYPQASMPPEPMVGGPTDGPSRFRRPARISFENAPPASKSFSMRKVQGAPTSPGFAGANNNGVTYRDERSSVSSYALERSMRSIANSDYSY